MLENLMNEFDLKSLFLNRSSFVQILFLKLIETSFKERVIFPSVLSRTPDHLEFTASFTFQ